MPSTVSACRWLRNTGPPVPAVPPGPLGYGAGLAVPSPGRAGFSSVSSVFPIEHQRGGAGNGPYCPPPGGWGLGPNGQGRRWGMASRYPDAALGGPGPLLLAVADLGPHPPLFPAHLASAFAFLHPLNPPFGGPVGMSGAVFGPVGGRAGAARFPHRLEANEPGFPVLGRVSLTNFPWWPMKARPTFVPSVNPFPGPRGDPGDLAGPNR